MFQRPKFAFCRLVPPAAGPNKVRFRRLNASARNSARMDSRIGNDFATETFSLRLAKLRIFGLVRVALPNWVVGCAPKNDADWKNLSTFGSNFPVAVVPLHPS